MDVKEKLDVFSRLVMSEAEEKRQALLADVHEQYETAKNEAERRARLSAEETIKRERYNAEQMKNKKIIETMTESKKALIELRSQLLQRLHSNIENRLNSFVQSEKYKKHLIDGIKQLAENYNPLEARIMSRDMAFAKDIHEQTGANIAQTDEDFIGGFKAVVNNGRALIDCTFKSRLNEELENFNEFKIT